MIAGLTRGGRVGHTRPYAWPYDGASLVRWAMLVVESADGPLPNQISGGVEALAADMNGVGCPVFRVRVGASASPSPAAWQTAQATMFLAAAGWNGFHGSPLDSTLRALGRDTLLITGCWLEVGVHSTLRAANDRGYECLVVDDLCAGYDADLRCGAISTIEFSGGIFGAVGLADDVHAHLALTVQS